MPTVATAALAVCGRGRAGRDGEHIPGVGDRLDFGDPPPGDREPMTGNSRTGGGATAPRACGTRAAGRGEGPARPLQSVRAATRVCWFYGAGGMQPVPPVSQWQA